jgi:hypothetical protein
MPDLYTSTASILVQIPSVRRLFCYMALAATNSTLCLWPPKWHKAAKLGLRGMVAIEEGYAFFHSFPDHRVDEADIEAKAPVLAEFIEASCDRYNFARRPIAIGFSNGCDHGGSPVAGPS